jgi:hypothetical protein
MHVGARQHTRRIMIEGCKCYLIHSLYCHPFFNQFLLYIYIISYFFCTIRQMALTRHAGPSTEPVEGLPQLPYPSIRKVRPGLNLAPQPHGRGMGVRHSTHYPFIEHLRALWDMYDVMGGVFLCQRKHRVVMGLKYTDWNFEIYESFALFSQ